jgi:putative salt-induced outer membrane protein YdiY
MFHPKLLLPCLVAACTTLLLTIATPVRADSLTLKNGDVLSGKLNRIENHVVYLQTEYAGELLVSTTEVAGMKTGRPVKVDFGDGETRIGKIEVNPHGDIRLVTATVVYAFDPNAVFRVDPLSPAERSANRFARPRVWDHNAEIGAQIRTGNSSAQDISLGYESRMTNESVELENDVAAGFGWAKGSRTTQQILGESRLDWSHTSRFYSFYSLNGQHDLLKGLYLRAREEAGVGYKLIKTSRSRLQADIGLGLGEDALRNAPEDIDALGHFGVLLKQHVGKDSELGLKSVMLPKFNDLGEFLADSEAWFQTPVTKRLLVKLSALDRFDSSPPAAIKKNDVTVKTSLVIVF